MYFLPAKQSVGSLLKEQIARKDWIPQHLAMGCIRVMFEGEAVRGQVWIVANQSTAVKTQTKVEMASDFSYLLFLS